MRAEEIRDERTLSAWLERRPRENEIAIAHRAALRVFPLYASRMHEAWAHKAELTSLPVLRCNLLSSVAATVPTAGIGSADTATSREAAIQAGLVANMAADAAARDKDHIVSASVRTVADAALAAETAIIPNEAAYSAACAARAAAQVGRAGRPGIAGAKDEASNNAELWFQVATDAAVFETGSLPLARPLWFAAVPDWFLQAENKMIALWAADPPERWDFWRRWWEGAKAGRYLDPQLQLAIVQGVSDETWDAGPDAVAARIREIEAEFNAAREPVREPVDEATLAEIIEATPNAERVEFDPEIEAIRAVPVSDLSVDHLRDAIDRLTDASEVFGSPDRFNNQYLALLPDVEKLRRALVRISVRPLRLHDVSADLIVRLDIRIRNGECPNTDKDALVASYKADLAGAMVDLQAHDPRVAEAVKARLTHGVEAVSEEDTNALADGVEAAAQITNELLRKELREDIATIRNPHATPIETRQAVYRLSSRLPRILWVYRKDGVEGFLKLTGLGRALEWSVSQIIRFLGFGG